VTGRRPALPDPVGHVMALLATRPRPRLVLGLAGLPGAGKSTLDRRIAQEANDRAGTPLMQTLGMDGLNADLVEAGQACADWRVR